MKFRAELPIDPISTGGSARHPSAPEQRDRYADQFFTTFSQVINNGMVNEIKGGFANFGFFRTGVVATPESILTTPHGPASSVPSIKLRGYTIGPSTNLPADNRPHSYSIRDDMSFSFDSKGRHNIRAGGEFLYNPDHIFIAFNGFGTLDAQGGNIPANIEALFPVWNDVSTWNIAALSPLARQYTLGVGDFGPVSTRKSSGLWLQDDWAIAEHVTLNLGVRYDLQIGALGESVVFAPFMPAQRPSDTNNVAPRLGFAWSVNDKTVIRGGFGKFFADGSDKSPRSSKANLTQINMTVLPDGRPDFASNPFNGPVPTYEQALSNTCTASTSPTCIRHSLSNMVAADLQIRTAHQASIGMQRQLTDTLAVTSDYVFVGSRHEITSQNINISYDPATGVNRNFNTISTRPFPEWGTLSMQFTNGLANTPLVESSFTKRFSQHWQASGSYTLSGLWDGDPQLHSGLTVVPFPVPADLGNDYGLAVTDQRHRAVFNGIWEAGFGFQLSGLYFFGSGTAVCDDVGRRSPEHRRRRGTTAPGWNDRAAQQLRRQADSSRGPAYPAEVPLQGRARIDGILESVQSVRPRQLWRVLDSGVGFPDLRAAGSEHQPGLLVTHASAGLPDDFPRSR